MADKEALFSKMDQDLGVTPEAKPENPMFTQMDKDLGLPAPKAPAAPTAVPEPDEPGYVGALGKGLGVGLKYGVPQQLAQSVERLSQPFLAEGAVSPAHAISEWGEEGQKKAHPEPYQNWLKEQVYQTGLMTPPSVVPSAIMGMAGLGNVAAALPAATFGLSQSQQSLESAKDRMAELKNQEDELVSKGAPYNEISKVRDQMEEVRGNKEITSIITGAIETFGETLGTIYLSKLFGPLAPMFTKNAKTTVEGVARPTLKRFLRELPKTIGVEAGTEVFQNWTEAEAEKRSGVRPEAIPWEEGVSAIAPTIGMTLLSGGIAHPFERFRARQIEHAMTAKTTRENIEGRIAAVNEVSEKIQEADKDVAEKWRARAYDAVLKGESIPLDADIREYAGIEVPGLKKEAAPVQAKQPEAAKQPEVAIQEESAAPEGAIPFVEEAAKEKPAKTEAKPEPFDMVHDEVPVQDEAIKAWQDLGKTLESTAEAKMPFIGFPPAKRPTMTALESALRGEAVDLTETQEERDKRRIEGRAFIKENLPKRIKEAGLEQYQGVIRTPQAEQKLWNKGYRPYRLNQDAQIEEDPTRLGMWARPKPTKPTTIQPESTTAVPEKPAAAIEVEAQKAATSPISPLPAPTEGQQEAGNYQKGHISFQGLQISIENPRGSTRSNLKASDIDALITPSRAQAKNSLESALASAKAGDYSGARNLLSRAANQTPNKKEIKALLDRTWASSMMEHYGYILGTKGKDKDHIDTFIGPDPASKRVFVVDQVKPGTSSFDEHKVMLGFNSLSEARQGYLLNYAKDWKGLKAITETDMDGFKEWLSKGDTTKEFAKEKTAIPEEKPKEPIREERNGKEVKPGVTLRNVAEDLMSADPQKEEVAIAMLVNAVRSGKITREDAMNTRNELINIAHERWTAAGKTGRYADYYKLTQEPAKRLDAVEKEMIEPGEKPETKAAIPETEKRDRDTIMKELMTGRGITPTQAAEELGIPLGQLKDEIRKYSKQESEKRKAAPKEAEKPEETKKYLGIPVNKGVTELTDEEFKKIIEPAPQGMEDRNVQLSTFENDPRFFVPIQKGEIGYQPGRPEHSQPVHTDWNLVRSYIETNKLTPRGREIQNIANRLGELEPAMFGEGAIKSAYKILQAVEMGRYNDMVHPQNKASRQVFAELTGQKLPPGVTKTQQLFKGEPFKKQEMKPAKAREFVSLDKLEKVSDDFYIVKKPEKRGEGAKFEKVQGQAVSVQGGKGLDLFIGKAPNGNSIITEGVSGQILGQDINAEGAKASVERNIAKYGVEHIKGLIQESINQNGVSPRYAEKGAAVRPVEQKGENVPNIERKPRPAVEKVPEKAIVEGPEKLPAGEKVAKELPADKAKDFEKYGKFQAKIVDGEYVRKNINEQYTNFATHSLDKNVPEGEIWIDQDKAHPDEYHFFLDNALAYERALAAGNSQEKAREIGDAKEKAERGKLEEVKKLKQESTAEQLKAIDKGILGTVTQPGPNKGVILRLVDGKLVRSLFNIDFVEGGHDLVYKRFIPKGEVWIDDAVQGGERRYIIDHELNERHYMAQGMKYPLAHQKASWHEYRLREGQAKQAYTLAEGAVKVGKVEAPAAEKKEQAAPPAEKAERPEKYFEKNPETGKLELHFTKQDFDALPEKVRKDIRSYFLWAPSRKLWVSKAHLAYGLYQPRVIAEAAGLKEFKEKGALDLTVSGQAKPVPDRPGVQYVVHKTTAAERKVDQSQFKVVMTSEKAGGGGWLSVSGKGMTAQGAYDSALRIWDEDVAKREKEGKPAAPAAEKPETKEPARSAAIGKISGGKVNQLEARGYDLVYGKATEAERQEMIGILSGGSAEKLIEAGITIKPKEEAKEEGKPAAPAAEKPAAQAEAKKYLVGELVKTEEGMTRKITQVIPAEGENPQRYATIQMDNEEGRAPKRGVFEAKDFQPAGEAEEKAAAETPEEAPETRPELKIPYQAVKYANQIANKIKKDYAWKYLNYAAGKSTEKPEPRGLSVMGAQAVRMSIDKLLETAYPDTYQAPEEAAHANQPAAGNRSELPERSLAPGPSGVAHGGTAEHGERPLPERQGKAENKPGPGGAERGEHAAGEQRPEPRAEGTEGVRGSNRAAGTEGHGREAAPGEVQKADKGVGKKPLSESDRNHRIGPSDELVPPGKISRIRANVDAISLLRKLQKEDRNPSPEEKKILARFTGWGALGKEAFEQEENIKYDPEKNGVLKSEGYPYFSDEQRKEYKAWYDRIGKQLHPDLGGALSKEEWDEAKSSILNAFYTSRDVIEKGLWPIVRRLGFKEGTIIEPAAGVGHILGLMPEGLAKNSHIIAVEKDKISGQILQKLYPQANVQIAPFEDVRGIGDNSASLVISNFPFGDIDVHDPRHKDYSMWHIHNYFFARSLDTVRPGGLVVAITSHYTMDAKGSRIRQYFAGKADLVGGIRLPNTAFAKNAGTEVTTDILVFRKKTTDSMRAANTFVDLKPVDVEKGQTWINEYFADHPEMVLGKHSMKGTMYGGPGEREELEKKGQAVGEYTVLPTEKDFDAALVKAVKALPEDVFGVKRVREDTEPKIIADKGTKEGFISVKDGEVVRNEDGILKPWATKKDQNAVAVRYINTREAAFSLMELERAEDSAEADIEQARHRLNVMYDDFVKKHGPISDRKNAWLSADAEYSFALSLEKENRVPREIVVKEGPNKGEKRVIMEKSFSKAKLFSERTNFPFKEPGRADNADDAVKISFTYHNKIDPEYIAELLGQDDPEKVKKDLVAKDLAYVNPDSGLMEAPFEYLSGDVREKLQKAQEAAKNDPIYDKNVEALKKVQPEDLKVDQLYFRLGSTWLPTGSIEDFIKDTLKMDIGVTLTRTPDQTNYSLRGGKDLTAEAKNVWGTKRADALSLIDDSLNLRFTNIYDEWQDPDGTKHRQLNKVDSAAAKDMQRRIQEKFVAWAKEHEKWGPELAKVYNQDMNNSVLMKVPVPDIKYYPNASTDIELYKHQKRGVSRGLMQSYLAAHEVGTGKTFIFATTAMEMRRLQTARKPMLVVHNSTVHQYAKAFRQLYPTANILVPDEDRLAAKNRKKLLGQIATQDYDAIVVPASWFDMLSVSPEKEAAYIQSQIADLEALIRSKEAEGEDKRKIRQIEKQKENKEARIKELLATGKKEDLLYFDDLNIDALLVDEAHAYKRAEYYSKLPNLKGIDRGSAARSTRLYLKSKEVLAKTGGKNIITATGTPISNTIAEAWSMIRYVRPDLLERFNSSDFDSFAANFGTIVQDVEETETGNFRVVERFARYANGPEMLKLWTQASDIVLAEDVEANRPIIKGGKPQDLQLERPEELAEFIKFIRMEREAWDAMDGKDKRDWTHIPLMLFNMAKAASVDLRIVDPSFPDLPNSKVNRAVKEVFQRWQDTKEGRLAQVIFCGGLGTPYRSGDQKFNVFEDLKAKLLKKGVPKNEIAIIHDFGKKDLEGLYQKINDGEIRVVMGTTEKLGIGANFQERLVAAHHLDVPHRPMDFEQRNGRIWRPGNRNKEIEILVYGVKNTLDSTSFQRNLIKKKFVNQLMRGNITDRSFEDPFDPTQGSFEDMVAAFGNPKVREKFGLESIIRDLESLKDSHNKEVGRARSEIQENKYAITRNEALLKDYEAVIAKFKKAFPKEKMEASDTSFKMGKLTDRKEIGQAINEETRSLQKTAADGIKELQEEYGNTTVPEARVADIQSQLRKQADRHIIEMNGIPVKVWATAHFSLQERRYSKRMQVDVGEPHLDGFDFRYEIMPGTQEELIKNQKGRGAFWTSHTDYFTHEVNTIEGIVPSVASRIGHIFGVPADIAKSNAKDAHEIKTLSEVLKSKFDREEELEQKKARLGEVEKELQAIQSGDVAGSKEEQAAEAKRLNKKFGQIASRLYSKKAIEGEESEEDQDREKKVQSSTTLPPQWVESSEGVKRSSDDYFISQTDRSGNSYFLKVEGKPVQIGGFQDFDLFVAQDRYGDWVVSEGKTGHRIPGASGESEEEAIQKAKEALAGRQITPANFGDTIERGVKQTGLSPRYAPPLTDAPSLKLLEKKDELDAIAHDIAGTKVLDESGKPRIMFHATEKPIEFREGQDTKFYSRPLKEEFGDQVYTAFLDIKKPAPNLSEWISNRDKYDGAYYASEDYQGNPGYLAVVKNPSQIHLLPEDIRDFAPNKDFPRLAESPPGWDRIEGQQEPSIRPSQRELNQISALVSRIAGSHAIFQDAVQVDLNDHQTQIGLKKHGWTDWEIQKHIALGYTAHKIAGSMTPVMTSPGQWNAVIRVAIGGRATWLVRSTALHEAYEAARKFMLTDKEIKILDQKIPGRQGKAASEIQADAFGDYFTERKGLLIPKTAQGFFDRIRNFFERIRNYLNGMGFQTADDIFKQIAAGEVKQRYRQGQITTAERPMIGKTTPALKLDEVREKDLNSIADIVKDMTGTVPLFKDVTTIDVSNPEMKKALMRHGYTADDIQKMVENGESLYYVQGVMRPVKVSDSQWRATIEVATRGREFAEVLKSALHESFEQARFFMLNDQERKILNLRFPGSGGEAANEIQADAFAAWWKTEHAEGLSASVLRIFAKIKSFFEAIGNYIHGLGFASSDEIFSALDTGAIRRRVRRGEISTGIRIPEFKQIPYLDIGKENQERLKDLTSGDMAQKAQQDKGFQGFVRKIGLNLVKITDNDLKLWERVLSLPYWLQDKYQELRPMVKTQMNREEARSQKIHDLVRRAQAFFTLKDEQLRRVEGAITAGDRKNTVWDEKTLRDPKGFNLDSQGVAAYRAVRDTLDFIHREWGEKIQENFLRDFERQRWFTLFKAAHDLEMTEEETNTLAQALQKSYRAQELPVQTVRRHLQKIFNEKLTQEDKRLLVKNYVEAWHKAKAALTDIKNIVKDAIGEGMTDEELNKETKGLIQAYIRSEPQAKLLKEMRDELNKIRGYFPRSRKQGKYRVAVTEMMEDPLGNQVPVTLFYTNAANRIEATRISNEVSANPDYKGMKITVQPVHQEAENSFMGASAINLQRLVDNAIEKLRAQGSVDYDTAQEIRMNVLETLTDDLKARGAGRYAIRRAGHIIEGYQKTNLKEVLKEYIDGWSGMMTKQDAALEFMEELKDIPREKTQLHAYASKYAQDMLRNQEKMDRVSQKFRGSAFVYFLGGSLRAALVNFTQNYVTGIPFLAREVGWKSFKAEVLYHKAMYDAAVGKNLTVPEKRMLAEMIDKGIAEDQYIQQITRETMNAVSARMAEITQLLGTPFSWIEKMNRRSSALASFRVYYDKAMQSGKTKEEAYKAAFAKAEDFVYKTQYLMTKANLPSLAAGGDVGSQFVKTAYTFRRFTHNYLLSLQNSFYGKDGRAALDVMGRSLAYLAILGGVPALPFLDDLMDLWEKFFGSPVRSSMRKTMRAIGGPVMEKMGMAGIPALIGIDISGSLKNQLPFVGVTPSDTIYGVYGGFLQKFVNAKDAMQRDDTLRAIEFASPAFIESALKAYRMAEVGATTPKGKVMTDEKGKPIRLDTGEAATQAIGFRPQRLSEIAGEHRTMQNVKAYFNDKRDDLYSRYRMAKTPEDKKAAIKDMQKYNMEARKMKGVIPPITMTSLREAVKQRPEKPFMAFGQMEGVQ